VRNLQNINPVAGPAEIAQIVMNDLGFQGREGGEGIADMMLPAIRAMVIALSGYDSFRDKRLEGGFFDKLAYGLKSQIPIVQDINLIRGADQDVSGRVYPEKGWARAMRFAQGNLRERPFNPEAAAEAAARQQGSGSPSERVARSVKAEQKAMLQAAKKYAGVKALPEKVVAAFRLKAERDGHKAEASSGMRSGTPEYARARLIADLETLQRWGVIDANQFTIGKQTIEQTERLTELDRWARWLSDRNFENPSSRAGYLAVLSQSRRELNARGADIR